MFRVDKYKLQFYKNWMKRMEGRSSSTWKSKSKIRNPLTLAFFLSSNLKCCSLLLFTTCIFLLVPTTRLGKPEQQTIWSLFIIIHMFIWRVCVYVCVRACVHACVCVCMCVREGGKENVSKKWVISFWNMEIFLVESEMTSLYKLEKGP